MSTIHTVLVMVLLVSLTQSVPFPSSVQSAVPSSKFSSIRSDEYRLPRDITPISYNISLSPNMEGQSFSFVGEVMINITFEKKTDMIKLHSKNLKLSDLVQLTCSNNQTYNLSKSEPNNTTDILILTIPTAAIKNITVGLGCNLTMTYEGGDSGDKRGFYRTSYMNEDGKQKWMASTLFEPIGARQVFPCWDEPDFKAKFKISIKHSTKYVALSNMHKISSQIDPTNFTMQDTVFAESPKMSSYLVAFAVGDFIRVDNDNLFFEVWTRKNVNDNAKYALQIGPKVLEALGNYTGIPYKDHKFLKMESLAVPELLAGAMENWGLVIYSERSFLYGGNMSSTMQKEVVTGIVAHELAHQWFGNLITAKWWDDIWLNEGFANYFQYVITDQIKPTWRMMDKFVVKNLQATAFVADSKNDSHAMYEKRENNDAIKDAFDNITYSKSGSILRMMSHVFEKEKFQTALKNYIKNNMFGSVTTENLIVELKKVTNNINSEKILKNWIETPGYPVISVARDYKNGTITITQSRFLDTNNTESKEKYWIPLNYVTEGDLNFTDTKVTDWFDTESNIKTIAMSQNTTDKFIIFNKQQFGYYRVNYDNKNWQMIIKYLQTKNHSNIHVLNRAQLIDDASNLARVGKLEYSIVLSLIEYLKVETDFIPWSAAWRSIEHILKFVANTDIGVEFKNYVLRISEKLINEVQTVHLNQTDHVMKLKRAEALKWACNLGSKSCQSEANKKLSKWLDNPETNSFPPDDVEWIICAGVRNANSSTWNKLWEKYMKEKDSKILMALGCTSDSQILNEYLSKVVSQNQTENFSKVFKAIYTGSSDGVNVVLNYMTKQYETISKLANYTKDQLKSDFTSLGQRLTTKVQYDLLKKFVDDKGNDSKGIADEALQIAGNNLQVFSIHLNQIQQFFEKKEPPSNNSSNKNVIFSTTFLIISFLISQIY